MKIFLKVREEYEQALMRDEEVVAGIPAYVLFFLAFSLSSLSSLLPRRRVLVELSYHGLKSLSKFGANEIDIMRNGIGNPPLLP
jgi:hypothetical protein